LVLAMLATACFAAYAFILPLSMAGWRGFALNLGTEISGILLTVLLIDAVIRRKDAHDQKRYRRIALQQLRMPLFSHLLLLSGMYKASVERNPAREISNLRDLFSEDYFEQIAYFNVMGPSPAALQLLGPSSVAGGKKPPSIPWYQYLNSEVERFKEDLQRVVDKYAMYLDPETIDLLEQLANSSFVVSAVDDLPRSDGPGSVRTFENPLSTKFGECAFHALGWRG
jgi:hypothetical protein